MKPDLDFLLKDATRIRALEDAHVIDTPPDEIYDMIAERMCLELQVPVALVSFIDGQRQFFKSQSGLPPDIAVARQMPLSHALCKHIISEGGAFWIRDIREHALYDHPVHRDYNVISYIGEPLIFNGEIIGAVCGIDMKPRDWTEKHKETLRNIAKDVQAEIYFRCMNDVS